MIGLTLTNHAQSFVFQSHVLFIRHGQTSWNAQKRLQGQKDIPLNETGEQQARDIGAILATLVANPEDWDVCCSPLGRTRQTLELAAEIFFQKTGQHLSKPNYDPRLLEVTFGQFEGLTLTELADQNPGHAKMRKQNPWVYCPPGGESYCDGAKRAFEWLREIDKPTIVVSHGGICRGLRKYLFDLEDQQAAKFNTPQGVVIEWKNTDEIFHQLS